MSFRILSSVIALSTFLGSASSIIAAEPETTTNEVHQARGLIREIAADRRTASIRHEAIPGYMAAMTMEFNVRDTNELTGITAGDTISFRLTATADTHWIDHIQKLASATNTVAPAPVSAVTAATGELKPGDVMPDYEFITENKKTVRLSEFRGKAVAFGFFFSRCPLPDFCPRICNNFAKARQILLAATNAPSNWQMLLISFDPDFDKPDVLHAYADFYRAGNPDRWLFAAAATDTLAQLAPRIDLIIMHEADGSISHNLRTVVLDPQGRVFKQFDGNAWTAEELAGALNEAARSGKQP